MRLKTSKGKKVFYSLISVFCFLCFYLIESLCFFCFLLLVFCSVQVCLHEQSCGEIGIHCISIVETVLFFSHKKHEKTQNAYKRTKIKKVHKKHLIGNKSLIHLFAFLWFCLVAFLCFLCFLCFWRVQNFFVKKKKINK